MTTNGMELRLQEFINAMIVTSDVANLSDETPQVMRRTSSSINKTSTFVVSINEPHDMVLPLNVIWICFDQNSPNFKYAFKRVSKSADPNNQFVQEWERLYFYEDIWDDQYYDADDQSRLTANVPNPASLTVLGIVKISHAPSNGDYPVAVTEGDDRLTDARDPLPHTHFEIPAKEFLHQDGIVRITGGVPAKNKVLIADDANNASWGYLTPEMIQANP